MLRDNTLAEYLSLLGSDAPAPGGGAAGALAGAQGAALGIMVIDLTLGREKYADFQDLCRETREELTELHAKLLAGVDRDAEAFDGFAGALKMPKDTDADKAARREALTAAAEHAAEVPFENMKLCIEAMRVIQPLAGKTNINAVSDIGVAVCELLSGIKSSWLNVKINLASIRDEAKIKMYEEECQRILREGEELASSIYKTVEWMV